MTIIYMNILALKVGKNTNMLIWTIMNQIQKRKTKKNSV